LLSYVYFNGKQNLWFLVNAQKQMHAWDQTVVKMKFSVYSTLIDVLKNFRHFFSFSTFLMLISRPTFFLHLWFWM